MILACAALATCLLGTEPAPSIVLDGRPVATVDAWTLREPAVQPEQEQDDEPDPAARPDGAPIIKGLLFGGGFGCVYGMAVAGTGEDISVSGSCILNGLFFAGVGAGIGAWIKALR